MAKFYSVGVGAGDGSYITLGALRALEQADIIAVPVKKYGEKSTALEIIRKEFDTDKKEISELEFRMSGDTKIREESRRNSSEKIISALKDGKDVAMVTLGDVSVYSTCTYVHNAVKNAGFELEIIPGITSFCAAADKAQISLCEGNESVAIIPSLKSNLLEKYIADFNTITAEASTGVVEISGMINQQSDKMIKISEDTKQLVDAFNTVLNDTSMQLSKRANNAYDKVKGLGENLKELSLQLEEATSMSAKHFENSGDKLRGTIGEIAANAERISNEIRSSGEVFLKQSGVLIAATEDTLKKVNDVMTSLNKNADEFSRRGSEALQSTASFSELYTKQMKLLSDTSAKAEKELKELEKSYHAMKTDTFLKDASAIIEKMETVAVDINRIFNPTVEEEIWKKYYNGDTSAFVRYLAKAMTKNQVLAIRKEFEENLEFRSLVTRYLSDFETLVSKARGNERSGILLSVISGADVGKLYYILAKSLDKLN